MMSVENSMIREAGVLNSAPPFFMNQVWIEKAKIPEKARTREMIMPVRVLR